jgi:galactofuranosylgalactofuranosylrhamnosyl-N-acetylglucosaminyl-diphospho-decaprenol beta-1,5/1,6-galactofuranosyltransferase
MCLIPTEVLRKVGLALPMFIKWDDAEFGLRASQHGFPTVSLPGVAVWHVPWHEKDDTIDWQAYFHERNRLLCALLYSPYKRGGRLPRASFEVVLKHALAMQYATAEMILQAIEDLLEGPAHMHRDILTKIGELRTLRAQSDDSRYEPKLRAYPPVRGTSPRRGQVLTKPRSRRAATTLALREIPRHFRSVPGRAKTNPQAALLHAEQKWWRLAQFDSVLVSSADGSGAAWLRRDPERYRSILWRSTLLHARLAREWDQLSRTYRQVVPKQAGTDAWADTFARSEATTTHSQSETIRDTDR